MMHYTHIHIPGQSTCQESVARNSAGRLPPGRDYSRMVSRRASTSSMMGSGTVSMRLPLRAPRSSTHGWSQRITPVVWVPAPSRETANPRLRAKLPPVVMGRTTGTPVSLLKASGGNDQYRSSALLFMTSRGVETDKPDVAALHYNSSWLADLASSQSTSKARGRPKHSTTAAGGRLGPVNAKLVKMTHYPRAMSFDVHS